MYDLENSLKLFFWDLKVDRFRPAQKYVSVVVRFFLKKSILLRPDLLSSVLLDRLSDWNSPNGLDPNGTKLSGWCVSRSLLMIHLSQSPIASMCAHLLTDLSIIWKSLVFSTHKAGCCLERK